MDPMRMQEELDKTAKSERKEEPWAVRSPRLAHEQAQERLARVNEPGRGFRNYSPEEREAARIDAAEKEKAYRQAANTHSREKYLSGLEEAKKAKAAERAAQEAEQQRQTEANLRTEYLTNWKAAGGDEKSFNASWESIKAEHFKRITLDQMSRPQIARF